MFIELKDGSIPTKQGKKRKEKKEKARRKKGHEFQYGRNKLSRPVWDQCDLDAN